MSRSRSTAACTRIQRAASPFPSLSRTTLFDIYTSQDYLTRSRAQSQPHIPLSTAFYELSRLCSFCLCIQLIAMDIPCARQSSLRLSADCASALRVASHEACVINATPWRREQSGVQTSLRCSHSSKARLHHRGRSQTLWKHVHCIAVGWLIYGQKMIQES